MYHSHTPKSLMIAALAAALFLSGATMSLSARDHDGHYRRAHKTVHRVRSNHGHAQVKRQSVHKNRHHQGLKIHSRHPRKEVVVRSLPRGYRTYRRGKQHYYWHKGTFYRHYDHGYVRIRAPRFYYLPHHARRIIVNGRVYFLCDNVYYIYHDGYYEMCSAPHVSNSITFGAWPFSITLTEEH